MAYDHSPPEQVIDEPWLHRVNDCDARGGPEHPASNSLRARGRCRNGLASYAMPIALVGVCIVGFGVGDGIVAACSVMILPTMAFLRCKNLR